MPRPAGNPSEMVPPFEEDAHDPDTDTLDRLAEEFVARGRRGEAPTISEYETRYPEWAERIRALFPSVAMMEQLKRRMRPARDGSRSSDAIAGGPANLLPDRFGEFQVVRELGRGGMGIVYEAVQESLNRHVALKVIPRHNLHDPKRVERFRRESQAVASLHHTNIVPVFGVGEHQGLPFYVMQYIEGDGLDRHVGRWRVEGPPRAREHWRFVATVGAQAAEALQYAHDQGVLHRDIKPANILIDEHQTAWITDFGLVKLVGRDDLTTSGDVIGTLRYLAPEALKGASDVRGDVYSLGLTLYELLTLQPPFGDVTPSELLRCVTAEQPTRPRKLDITIPIDLETIVLKATAREPQHRYATAGRMAADLRSFLEDRPIRARRASTPERFTRWCRRNKVVASLTATAALSLLLAAIVGCRAYASTTRALESELRKRNEAEQATKLAQTATRRAEENVTLSLEAFGRLFDTLAARGDFRPGRGGDGPGGQRPMPGPADLQGELARRPPRGPLGGELEKPRFGRGGPARRPTRQPGDGAAPPPPEQPWRDRNGLPENDVLLIGNILSFYDAFAEKNETNSKLQGEAARANRRVAALYRWLGREREADETYQRAAGRYEALAARFPDDPLYRFELARTYAMDDAWPAGLARSADDEERLRKALNLVRVLAIEFPDEPQYPMARARWLCRLGLTLDHVGRAEQAEVTLRESIAIDQSLFAQYPATIMFRMGMAATQDVLIGFLARHDRRDEAIRLLSSVTDDLRSVTVQDLPGGDEEIGPVVDRLERLADRADELGEHARAGELMKLARATDSHGPQHPRRLPRYAPGIGPNVRESPGSD